MKGIVKILGDLPQIITSKISIAARRQQLSSVVARAWREAVMTSGISARAKRRYSQAIEPMKSRPGAVVKDFVSQLLEFGWKRFDMKPGLLRNKTRAVVPISTSGGTVFRSVSAKSPPSSWIHPGFRGAGVVEPLREKINKLIAEALKDG